MFIVKRDVVNDRGGDVLCDEAFALSYIFFGKNSECWQILL